MLCATTLLLLYPTGEASGRPIHSTRPAKAKPLTSEGCNKLTPTPAACPSLQHEDVCWFHLPRQVTFPSSTRAGSSRDSPSLGNVPGEQRAQAVTFTPLQFEGLAVVRNGAADGTPGDVVTPEGDGGAPVDAAIAPVDA